MPTDERESQVQLSLETALDELEQARRICDAVGALGMSDDIRKQIRELEKLTVWTLRNPGWTTKDPE